MQITQISVHAQEHRNVGDYSSYESYVNLSATLWPGDDPELCIYRLQEEARKLAVGDCDRFVKEKAEAERVERDGNELRNICEVLMGEGYRERDARDEDADRIDRARRIIDRLPTHLRADRTVELERAIEANKPVQEGEARRYITSTIDELAAACHNLRAGHVFQDYQIGNAREKVASLPAEMQAQQLALLDAAIEANRIAREQKEAAEKEKRRQEREAKKAAKAQEQSDGSDAPF